MPPRTHPLPLPPRVSHALPRYKAPGVQAIDENGTRDTIEFINVSRDDALAWPQVVHRTYPSAVSAHMEATIRPFVEKAQAVNGTLLGVFNERLGLPRGALAGLHREGDHSSSLARCIRAPPHGPDEKLFIPAHTDYGTLVSTAVSRDPFVLDLRAWALRVPPLDVLAQPHWWAAGPSARRDRMALCEGERSGFRVSHARGCLTSSFFPAYVTI